MKYIFLLLFILCSCNVQKRIDKAKVDAVMLDHILNPCANDTVIVTNLGETLVLIDTVIKTTTNVLNHVDTVTNTITIIKKRVDTIKVIVLDKRGLKDAADSVAHYKLINAHLQGQYAQQGQTLTKAEKRARLLFVWLIALCAAIAITIFINYKKW